MEIFEEEEEGFEEGGIKVDEETIIRPHRRGKALYIDRFTYHHHHTINPYLHVKDHLVWKEASKNPQQKQRHHMVMPKTTILQFGLIQEKFRFHPETSFPSPPSIQEVSVLARASSALKMAVPFVIS